MEALIPLQKTKQLFLNIAPFPCIVTIQTTKTLGPCQHLSLTSRGKKIFIFPQKTPIQQHQAGTHTRSRALALPGPQHPLHPGRVRRKFHLGAMGGGGASPSPQLEGGTGIARGQSGMGTSPPQGLRLCRAWVGQALELPPTSQPPRPQQALPG